MIVYALLIMLTNGQVLQPVQLFDSKEHCAAQAAVLLVQDMHSRNPIITGVACASAEPSLP